MSDNDFIYDTIFATESYEWLVDIDGLVWGFNSKESAEAFIGISKKALLANVNNMKDAVAHVSLIRRRKHGIH